ncbi:2,3-bisphosphoglycerate-independent phosphoglycerate mutase [Helicobacter jaachi]|uniref:2,3-bisphosphoglycerate-independent phosphoglycerate mutase n=1 Tax=Helicobacter jaachi TaxID=1677920 RepID=A0A4V6I2S4_9HELI|nr:2,3-bisphosphoglycerate-independent phosphoglycerate mutase [Helicobacter jaachi]TLD97192.1 2,3-bisphosphoglycerate-independent phosphoglycerate mutase [Helicobacter jaachi]
MKTILVITDGIGYSEKTAHNAFYQAKKPTYDYLFKHVPYGMIDTFGLSVGLPSGQMGNSEVGHMCIGSGRVLYQDLVRISRAIEQDEIKSNPAFLQVANNASVVHLCGLLSDGGVHAHIAHLKALAQILYAQNKRVYLHLITDGRDVLPQSALTYLADIESICNDKVSIASIAGRFYAMDRDKRWDRVQKAYESIAFGANPARKSPKDYIQSQYDAQIYDEFIVPASFNDFQGMHDNEGFIFVNFRSDRAREIVEALGNPQFKGFERQRFIPLHIATMTEYDALFPYPVLFPKQKVEHTLAQVISQHGLKQLHTAETEKYAHVTFFLNGGREEAYEGEERVLIPSPNVKTYDLQPQMCAKEVGDVVIKGIEQGYDFIVVNFANGDMVGHTGNFKAAVEAVEAVDRELGRILEAAKAHHYALFITSDHGNCEEMKDEQGNTLTNHTVGQVWCFGLVDGVDKINDGGLNNIAPSVLKAMGLDIPKEMDKPLF